MPRTLVTFLGTGSYSETLYEWAEWGSQRTAYVAEALSRLWNADRTIVLATDVAREKNGTGLLRRFADGHLAQPQFSQLKDGRTPQELWAQFETLRGAIQSSIEGHILIDITHGFRAQPFFAGAVLNVLQAAQIRPATLTLVYGEYRASEEVSPIWDITLFPELMEWAEALGLFLRTGVAWPLVELGRRMQRQEGSRAAELQQKFPEFSPLTTAIEQFAADLATVRVASIITGYEQDNKKKCKARGSAARLLDAIERCREDVGERLPPLALILDRVAADVRPLVAERLFSEEGRKAQAALASLYLKLERYPEAAVVAREAIVNSYASGESAVEVNSTGFDDKRRDAADCLFGLQDQARQIGDIRNDIEHGGFRKQPAPASALKSRIKDMIAMDLVGVRAAEAVSGRTFFVTRHPGAVEWAAAQGFHIDLAVPHLDVEAIRWGDVVIGTLPVNLAAEVCAKGARYLHLSLRLPPDHRGVELSAEDMTRFGAQLVEHRVTAVNEDPL